MRIYRRLPIIQSGIAERCRNFWLFAAGILASLALSEPALAQTFDFPSGPYPTGISASQPTDAVTDMHVTLQSGVNVTGLAAPHTKRRRYIQPIRLTHENVRCYGEWCNHQCHER